MSLDWKVPPFWAINIARQLEDRTGTATGAVAEVGLPPDLLSDAPDHVRIGDEVALLDIAVRDTGDDSVACAFGLGFDPRRTSLLSYLLLNARTLGDGLRLAQRYLRIERQSAVLSSRIEGDVVFLRVDAQATELREHARYIEHALGVVLAVIRRAVATDVTPREVHLGHRPAPPLRRRLGDCFASDIVGGTALPGLVFDRATLELPLVDPDTVLLPHLTAHAQTLLDAHIQGHGDLAQRVRADIASRLSHGTPTKTETARTLGMSPRTLSRRLASEGCTYEGLLLALRRDLAQRYLADPTLGLAQVAHTLGYADQPSFTTAYKRWTGRTPAADRSRGTGGTKAKSSGPS